MRRFVIFLLCFLTLAPVYSQTRTKAKAKQTQTTTKKTTAKKTATVKKTTQKKAAAKPATKKQLQNKKAETRKKLGQSRKESAELNRNIKLNLDSVMIIDNQMTRHQKAIDSLQADIKALNTRINRLGQELEKLQAELDDKKQKYAKALVYMRRQKSVQQKLMFIFSADNFTQMIRRMRYMREYSTFQRAQGELIRQKQMEVRAKQNELLAAKAERQKSMAEMERKQAELKSMKESCEKKVAYLNKNLQNVQRQIEQYQKEEAELDRQIDKIIQQEIAEAKRKAEEERRKREAEAKRQAAQKLEAAKEAKRKAEEASRNAKSKDEKKKAKEQLDEADKAVKAAEKEEREEKKRIEKWVSEGGDDVKLSKNFVANKGRLPMPITGAYSVVGHFGRYAVAGLRRVVLDNKGMDIRGKEGASARSVFDGEVSSVFKYGDKYIVMVRHGSYISVYSGLSSVVIKKGAKVKTRDILGPVAKDKDGTIKLHFQLRKESQKLNPEQWVR